LYRLTGLLTHHPNHRAWRPGGRRQKRQTASEIAFRLNLPFRLSPSNRASGRNATNDFVSEYPEVSDLSASFPTHKSWEPRRIFCSGALWNRFRKNAREPLHF